MPIVPTSEIAVKALASRLRHLILDSQPCRVCKHAGPRVVAPGKGPHHACVRCGQCNGFVRWLGKMAVDILAVLEGEVHP